VRSRARINDEGAIVGTATYSGTNYPTGSHGVMLIPFKLVNLADPYQGSAVIGTPSHNDQDTPIDLSSTTNSTDINGVAWIAAGDASTSNAPRMPKLQATLAAPNGTTVWWKLSVINHGLHGPGGNPYRDFDTGVSLTPAQVTKLTNSAETGTVGYSDNIAVPLPSGSYDGSANADGWRSTSDGWVTNAAGTPWNIYQDNDWQTNAARGFFGGDAQISMKVTSSDGSKVLVPQQDFYFRIAGENPTADPSTGANAGAGACQDYITSLYGAPTPNWTGVVTYTPGSTNAPTVPSYWFAYAIAKEETDGNGGRTWYNQFRDNGGRYNTRVPGKEGYPNWNDDSAGGSGGYGLFQLTYQSDETNFIMPRDWLWNWKSNVGRFLPKIQQKLKDAQLSLNGTRSRNPTTFTDPTPLTTTAGSTTTFCFWESAAIRRFNSGRGWNFSTNTFTWSYTPTMPSSTNYLYNVAHKGIENHP